MPWFKVDDGFHAHQKAVRAGTAALGLWVRCGSWAAQQLTGGMVPTHIALFYGSKTCVKALVESGLWEEVEGGYQFHDWPAMNPTREQVLSDREAAKERQRHAREAARQKREVARSSAEVTDLSRRDTPVTTPDVQSPRPDPTRPEGSKEPSESRKRATQAPDLFPVTEQMRQWADERRVQVDLHRETESFLDHHRAKGSTFKDWHAAWRTWMNNSIRYGPARPAAVVRDVPVSQRWMQANQ